MPSSIDTIHWWNTRLSPPIGFLANFWFLWMILYRTPKEMIKHSRILLQTCALDIIFLVIFTIGLPLGFESNQVWLFLIDGLLFDQFYAIFGNLGVLLQGQLYYGFNIIENMGICLQFVYRYLLLIHNFQIGLRRYLLLLAIPFMAIMGINSYFFIVLYPDGDFHSGNVQESVIDLNEWKFYFTFSVNINQMIICYGLGLLIIFVAYAIITFCGVKMVKFVSHSGFSENTKRLNKQLTKTLIILSLLPLILIFCGLFTAINFAITTNSAASTNNLIAQGFVNQILVLLPILNPLVGIATNSPYRNAAMFWRKRKIEPKPAVIVQNFI